MPKTPAGQTLPHDTADDIVGVTDESEDHSSAGRDSSPQSHGVAAEGSIDHDTGDSAGAPLPRQKVMMRAAVAALTVIAVVSSACAGVFGWKLMDRAETDAAARQAAATARNYAVTLTSIDSQHIDQNYAEVLNGATGEFKDMYSQSSGQLKKLLIDGKAVSKGRVVDSSIKSVTKDKVEVMLFVDQEITNAASPDPRVDRSRIVMTMQRVGGRWLAGKVEMA